MALPIWSVLFWLTVAAIGEGQQIGASATIPIQQKSSDAGLAYSVQGTTPEREQLLRTQLEAMHPVVLPNRIVFVPHWQYVNATRMYHLHVPTGMTGRMFTHLPSRSIYIDSDFYDGADWLGHRMAHELGHLERNNTDENEAEKSAALYRRRLERIQK